LIEEEEDRIDIVETEKILADVKEQGTVPWERIKSRIRALSCCAISSRVLEAGRKAV